MGVSGDLRFRQFDRLRSVALSQSGLVYLRALDAGGREGLVQPGWEPDFISSWAEYFGDRQHIQILNPWRR